MDQMNFVQRCYVMELRRRVKHHKSNHAKTKIDDTFLDAVEKFCFEKFRFVKIKIGIIVKPCSRSNEA